MSGIFFGLGTPSKMMLAIPLIEMRETAWNATSPRLTSDAPTTVTLSACNSWLCSLPGGEGCQTPWTTTEVPVDRLSDQSRTRKVARGNDTVPFGLVRIEHRL